MNEPVNMSRKVKGHYKTLEGGRRIFIKEYVVPEKTDDLGLTEIERSRLVKDALLIYEKYHRKATCPFDYNGKEY